MPKKAIPIKRVASVSPADDGRHLLMQFEAHEDGFPLLAIPTDQAATLTALLTGAAGGTRPDGKPVGVVSPDRAQVFTHKSDPGAVFMALGVGTFDLVFSLRRDQAAGIEQGLVEALSQDGPGTRRS